MVTIATFNDSFERFMHENKWLFWVCFAVNLVIFYVMIYVRSACRKIPINFILLGIFTLTQAYMVSYITTFYDPITVFIAAVLTAVIVVALTIYACTTKTDFTVCGGLLFVAISVLFVASIISIFFYNKWVSIVISALSVIVFSIYLVYDTQLILGNGKHKLTIDDYIYAALMLYLDIIRIFLEILKLVGHARN
jgi:FtsH-binding integral membrane protein